MSENDEKDKQTFHPGLLVVGLVVAGLLVYALIADCPTCHTGPTNYGSLNRVIQEGAER